MADAKTAFVTGWPVKHSRSPLIHRYWLKKYDLAGDYVKHPCAAEEFSTFLTSLADNGYVGGNITVPHKETAFELVERTDAVADALGAVNTVWIKDNILHGTNTDEYGFLANLDDRCPGWDNPDRLLRGALVIGAGGASRAIVHALITRKFSRVTLVNRTRQKAQTLAEFFGPACHAAGLDWLDNPDTDPAIIINTTSLGMNDGKSPAGLREFSKDTIVSDIVYTPLQTPLLLQAAKLGMVPVDGLGMLLHQAVLGFEKWFGVRPQVDEDLRALILRDLGEAQ